MAAVDLTPEQARVVEIVAWWGQFDALLAALDAAEKERDAALKERRKAVDDALGVRAELAARVAALENAIRHVVDDSPGIPDSAKKYLCRAVNAALAGSMPPAAPVPARPRHQEDDGA